MRGSRAMRSASGAGAGDDVDHPGGQAGGGGDFGQQQRRAGGLRGRADHERAADGESRGDLVRAEVERPVEGGDRQHRPDREASGEAPAVLAIVDDIERKDGVLARHGQAGGEAKGIDPAIDLDARHGDRLAGLLADRLGHFGPAGGDAVAQGFEPAGAFVGGGLASGGGRGGGRCQGRFQLRLAGPRHLGEGAAVVGTADRAAALARNPLSVHVKIVVFHGAASVDCGLRIIGFFQLVNMHFYRRPNHRKKSVLCAFNNLKTIWSHLCSGSLSGNRSAQPLKWHSIDIISLMQINKKSKRILQPNLSMHSLAYAVKANQFFSRK